MSQVPKHTHGYDTGDARALDIQLHMKGSMTYLSGQLGPRSPLATAVLHRLVETPESVSHQMKPTAPRG
jgi:hypothetical protein